MRLKLLLPTLPFLFLLIVPFRAAAQGGAWISIEQEVLSPGEKVVLVVVPDEDQHRVTIACTRDDGKVQNFTAGRTVGGTRLTFAWTQPEGEHSYAVVVELVSPDGYKDTIEQSVSATVAGPFQASIPAEKVVLDDRTFQVISNREVSAVQIEILDEDLDTVFKDTVRPETSVRGQPTTIQWPATDSEVPIFRIWVRTFDKYNFWADNEIIPWSLSIPHEDVHFGTNLYEITDEEAPKLDRAYKEIRKAVDKYGEFVQCSLYIAGYTDTVGPGGSNQTLSNNRARSIAKYFQKAGFEFSIYYQGFGESVLAEPTEDNVENGANRRALYVIAAGSPKTKDIPRSNWTKLQ